MRSENQSDRAAADSMLGFKAAGDCDAAGANSALKIVAPAYSFPRANRQPTGTRGSGNQRADINWLGKKKGASPLRPLLAARSVTRTQTAGSGTYAASRRGTLMLKRFVLSWLNLCSDENAARDPIAT